MIRTVAVVALVGLLSVWGGNGVDAAVIKRKASDGGPTRYILYHSRHLEGNCLKTCSPTKKPTLPPTKPPTKTPTKPPTKTPTKPPTKTPTKTPTKPPTKTPTKAPTRIPTAAPTCPKCPIGTVRSGLGCGCTENCCSTCPKNTKCFQIDVNGEIIKGSTQGKVIANCTCISCQCGFCDHEDFSCCNLNGGDNNCNPNNRYGQQTEFMDDCAIQNGRWPQLGGATGNVCSGVEVNPNAMPNGCGCQPSQEIPCTYDPIAIATNTSALGEDQCFICDVEDLVKRVDNKCDLCIPCLKAAWVGPPNSCKRMRELQNNNNNNGANNRPTAPAPTAPAPTAAAPSSAVTPTSTGSGAGTGNSGAADILVPCSQTQAQAFACIDQAIAQVNSTKLTWCFRQIYSPNNYVFDSSKRQLCYQECSKILVKPFRRLLQGWEALEAHKRGMDLDNIPMSYNPGSGNDMDAGEASIDYLGGTN